MNTDNKRKFIYNKLKVIDETKNDIIHNYIINNSKHSVNKNGLIINLSILHENDINYIYDIINIVDNNIPLHIPNEKNEMNIKYKKKIIKKQKLYLNIELTKLEKKILSYI